ncbi:MAG: tripartite tricarboxylate transporter substrate binding protein, partial [Betaproteobacteria bacterium]|nr:tripartite tricarboxylate transporter substrate binding protein [Betaproteobacteria bacterium]
VYFGLLAPAATPTALVERLHADARTVLALPEVMTQLRSLGQDPVAMPPEAFARYLRDEIMTWTELVAKTGLNMD